MIKFDRLTAGARWVLQQAQQESVVRGHRYIGTEHLLLGLIAEPDGPSGWALAEMGWSPEQARTTVEAAIQQRSPSPDTETGLTPDAKRAIENAVAEANRLGHHYVSSEHLLLGLLADGLFSAEIIQRAGIIRAALRASVERRMWEGV